MRNDTITLTGPWPVEDLVVGEVRTEDGELESPEHTIPMGHMRRIVFETDACVCGQRHGFSVSVEWRMVVAYPEVLEHTLDYGYRALLRSLADHGTPVEL
jgi:hypothetical protein